MNADDVAERLAAALAGVPVWPDAAGAIDIKGAERLAKYALLPVVDAIAEERARHRAAIELERTASRIREGYPLVVGNLSIELDRIEARAAALRSAR